MFPPAAVAQTTPTTTQLADLSTCLLPNVAFCDDFHEGAATNSARSGALDETKWSVSHVTGLSSLGQGQANEFYPSDYMHCMDPATGLLPPKDYFMCAAMMPDGSAESMHMMEAFNDGGNYDYNSAMARQPFDFAGRTGTIAFDVDAKTDGGHFWWPEIWITPDPAPAPHVNTSPSYPRDGIGIELNNEGPSGTPVSADATGTGLGNVGIVDVVRDYVPTLYSPANGLNLNGFYKTQPDSRNRFQIRLSQNEVQVWATDADGTNFREVADLQGINLGFTRGYVAFQHADYNPGKFGTTSQQTYHWDNLGFDGPVLPPDRGTSVPDALTPGHDAGALNLGYVLDSSGIETCCTAPHAPFTLAGVDPSGAVEADLTMNVWWQATTNVLHYRLNGGPSHDIPYPAAFPATWSVPVPMTVPVPLSELRAGTNTVALSADQGVQAGNIDLVLRMSAPADPGTVSTGSSSTTTTATSSTTSMSSAPTTTASTTSSTTSAPAASTTTSASAATVTVTQTVTSTVTAAATSPVSFTLACTEQNGDPKTIVCKVP